MPRYTKSIIKQAQGLRSLGKTYTEIRQILALDVPKSTLSYWCQTVILPAEYVEKIAALNVTNRDKGRAIAIAMNKLRKEAFLSEITRRNAPVVNKIQDVAVAKIALAMLCLGEASKYKSSSSFSLGSSDPRIITIFLELLKKCFDFKLEKVRCTVQCRADQDVYALKKYWGNVTGVPDKLFYKSQIDPRTIGKPTKRLNYKGVLRVDYFDRKAQLELESLADLVYNQLDKQGPVA